MLECAPGAGVGLVAAFRAAWVSDDDLASSAGVAIVIHAHAPTGVNVIERVDELNAIVVFIVEVVAGSAYGLRLGLTKRVEPGGFAGLVRAFAIIAITQSVIS